jgi:hypothetical protein
MSTYTQKAIREWDGEVDAEVARLIRAGVPPYQAARQAVENISAKRATTQRPS